MVRRSAPPPEPMRSAARRVYGADPDGYDAGRPDYPARVYEILAARCAVEREARVLEIGAGTGRVTRRLLAMGARVVAVEPDPALATRLGVDAVDVVPTTFEGAPLPDSHFDAVVAAMAFHWVDQRVGLPKLGRVLRPGGAAALWWTVFGDPERDDPFHTATADLLAPSTRTSGDTGPQFELDVAGRRADLVDGAGLVDVDSELIRWTARVDAARLRALYASMIAVRMRPVDERERLLDTVVAIVERDFGGFVERPFVTAVYTGRRSPRDETLH